jgi:hypothetical protein
MATPENMSSHRDSIAWQKGMELSKLVYLLTQSFPADERFGLTNQLKNGICLDSEQYRRG